MMIDPASRNDQGKLKSMCLQRDGWKCMVTGMPDTSKVRDLAVPSVITRLAHILPFSIGKWEDTRSDVSLFS
jgi:hypothetical protein